MARLARLILADDEIAAMQRDLGSILEHVERIGELDLEHVRPTSHVAAEDLPPSFALREDEPSACLPREVALAEAPAVADDGFLVPSPQA